MFSIQRVLASKLADILMDGRKLECPKQISILVFQSMPFFYPANRLEYFNGTKFNDSAFPSGLDNIIGFQGHVTPDVYAAMLKQPHFGKPTKMTFDGYNSEPGGFFPFWSSEPYTYSMALVVLSQYRNIQTEATNTREDIVG